MIASAFCIKITDKILCLFYWGEIDGYEKISPIPFLSHNLISFCRENNFEILDLGTSSKNSLANVGLINFKQSIGATSCSKFKLKNIFIKNFLYMILNFSLVE